MKSVFASLVVLGLLSLGQTARAQDSSSQETLFLKNDSTQQVIEVSQAGKIEPVADPLEIQALEEKLQLASQDSDLRGLGIGIGLGRGGIGGGIRIGPIGGGVRIGRGGIRVGGHAGRAGAGARVGRRGVRAGAGVRASFWDGGQWESGKYNKRAGQFAGQWTPLAVGY